MEGGGAKSDSDQKYVSEDDCGVFAVLSGIGNSSQAQVDYRYVSATRLTGWSCGETTVSCTRNGIDEFDNPGGHVAVLKGSKLRSIFAKLHMRWRNKKKKNLTVANTISQNL